MENVGRGRGGGQGKRKTRHVREETAEMKEAGIPSKTKETLPQCYIYCQETRGRDTLRGSNACAEKNGNNMC